MFHFRTKFTGKGGVCKDCRFYRFDKKAGTLICKNRSVFGRIVSNPFVLTCGLFARENRKNGSSKANPNKQEQRVKGERL